VASGHGCQTDNLFQCQAPIEFFSILVALQLINQKELIAHFCGFFAGFLTVLPIMLDGRAVNTGRNTC
jgi:hypothetical protein